MCGLLVEICSSGDDALASVEWYAKHGHIIHAMEIEQNVENMTTATTTTIKSIEAALTTTTIKSIESAEAEVAASTKATPIITPKNGKFQNISEENDDSSQNGHILNTQKI